MCSATSITATGYEICFRSLSNRYRALHFPCDAQGQVPLDALRDYLFARAVVGREFARPAIVPRAST
jgi:hypothetical protein